MTTEQDERRLAEIRKFVSPADTVTDRVFLLQIIDQTNERIARLEADYANTVTCLRNERGIAGGRIRQLDAENQGFMREVAILTERIARLEGALETAARFHGIDIDVLCEQRVAAALAGKEKTE